MWDWISENWLALYGSIVGTVALFLNFSRFIHTVNKGKVKLSIDFKKHPNFENNLKELTDTSRDSFTRANMAELYVINIKNIGSISAYIEDAGIITSTGKTHHALISYDNTDNQPVVTIGKIPDVGQIKIEPKSSKKVSVYLNINEKPFIPIQAFVEDSTGKKWSTKAKK